MGKEGFGDGAKETLAFVIKKLIPAVKTKYDISQVIPSILGGYSLAGLFALWSAYQTNAFRAIAAASPNEGNHFKEADIRTAKGFSWCIERI